MDESPYYYLSPAVTMDSASRFLYRLLPIYILRNIFNLKSIRKVAEEKMMLRR